MNQTEQKKGSQSVGNFVERSWFSAFRRYITVIASGNLLWEFAHLPLYTLWETGSTSEIVFAALHCTGGDILIGLSSVMLALFLVGNAAWPAAGNRRVVLCTVLTGLFYTLFSEWLNIEVREAWAYRDIMPLVPGIDAGLSPVMQWIVIPLVGFNWALRTISQSPKKRFVRV